MRIRDSPNGAMSESQVFAEKSGQYSRRETSCRKGFASFAIARMPKVESIFDLQPDTTFPIPLLQVIVVRGEPQHYVSIIIHKFQCGRRAWKNKGPA